jgi:DNA repair exonuclease SbcCD nuclease subunit
MQVPDAALHAALARKWDEALRKLEREIVRDKDLEREASLQAMAARAKLELDAAVLAAKLTCEQQHAAALPSLPVVLIAGNHDSATRLAWASAFLPASATVCSTLPSASAKPPPAPPAALPPAAPARPSFWVAA